jgi:hypothetical protein
MDLSSKQIFRSRVRENRHLRPSYQNNLRSHHIFMFLFLKDLCHNKLQTVRSVSSGVVPTSQDHTMSMLVMLITFC